MKRSNRRRVLAFAAAAMLCAGPSRLEAQSAASKPRATPIRTDSITRIAHLRADSVVALHTLTPLDEASDRLAPGHVQEGLGSGVVIDTDGLILTNAHVIDGVKVIHVWTPEGDDVAATVIGSDPDLDLVLLRASDARGLRAAPLGDSDRLEVGEWVVAIGNPFGLHHTVTAGIVSAKGGTLDDSGVEFLQTDTALGPGSSGGPLLDLAGNVVGISVGILPPGGMNVGLNLAIPAALVKEALPQLLAGRVEHGWIGVVTTPLSAGGAAIRKLRDGLFVTAVTEDGPAAQAGLLAGDIVIGFADNRTVTLQGFYAHVRRQPPGTVVPLDVWRNGKRVIVPVEVGRRSSPNHARPSAVRE